MVSGDFGWFAVLLATWVPVLYIRVVQKSQLGRFTEKILVGFQQGGGGDLRDNDKLAIIDGSLLMVPKRDKFFVDAP